MALEAAKILISLSATAALLTWLYFSTAFLVNGAGGEMELYLPPGGPFCLWYELVPFCRVELVCREDCGL